MKKRWAILSVAVVFVLISLISCTKSKVAVEEVTPAQIRSSESAQSADKAEIARLHGIVAEAKKEIKSLQEGNNALTQANRGLAEELLVVKKALKEKESELSVLSGDLKRTFKKGERALVAQIAELNKEKDGLIASQFSLSEKLRVAEEREKKIGDEASKQKALYVNEVREGGKRLQEKDVELTAAQENADVQKMAAIALMILLFFAVLSCLHLWTRESKVIKPQRPVPP